MADDQTPADPSVDPYATLAQSLHADRIDAAHAAHVAQQVASIRAAVAKIRAVPLTNADEPEARFAAYRADG